jgi:hypothetical protein
MRMLCVRPANVAVLADYVISETFGEAWTDYSFLQLAGFLILICGTVTYNKLIKWPCVRYPEEGK